MQKNDANGEINLLGLAVRGSGGSVEVLMNLMFILIMA